MTEQLNLAITGASGFLANYLIRDLLKDNSNQLHLFTTSFEKTAFQFGNNPNCKIVETDYSIESLKKNFTDFDCIFHLAAQRYVKGQDNYSDYAVNEKITNNFITVCNEFNVSNFVFASTRLVYSFDKNNLPFKEIEIVSPVNPYAQSKLNCEKLCLESGLNAKCLRFSQLVGWGERDGYMLMTFIKKAIKGEPLTVFGNGTGARDYLYAKDAISAMFNAMNLKDFKGVINIGSGIPVTHYELACLCSEIFSGGKSEVIVDKSKEEDKSICHLDNSKAKEVLGWQPQFNLRDALLDMKIII